MYLGKTDLRVPKKLTKFNPSDILNISDEIIFPKNIVNQIRELLVIK